MHHMPVCTPANIWTLLLMRQQVVFLRDLNLGLAELLDRL